MIRMLKQNAVSVPAATPRQAELREGPKPEPQRAAERDLDRGGGEHQRRRQLHVAGAAQDRGKRLHQPRDHGAAEEDVHIAHRLAQHASLPAEQGEQRAAEHQHHEGEGEAEAGCDHQRMHRQRGRASVVARAERTRDRRGHAAAHRAAGHRHRHHDEREHQRHRRERFGAEAADVRCLGDHHGHAGAERKRIGRRKLQQPRQNRIVQQGIWRRRRSRRERWRLDACRLGFCHLCSGRACLPASQRPSKGF